MASSFAFHAARYLAGFPHVGAAEFRRDAPAGVIRRTIAGSDLVDGLGPWPYFRACHPGDVAALAKAFPDLVTVAIITQPGFQPEVEEGSTTLLKDHFLFDPDLPPPPLSRRARQRIREVSRTWQVDCPDARSARLELAGLYRQVALRRAFAGGFFDFPPAHFAALAGLDGMAYFRIGRDGATGGMACGALFEGELHLLHIAIADDALAQNVSYPLMQAILDHCRERKLLMMMGGTPRTDGEGIARFKRRWTNRRAPVYLTKAINRPDAYAALCGDRPASAFFPAYRSPTEFR